MQHSFWSKMKTWIQGIFFLVVLNKQSVEGQNLEACGGKPADIMFVLDSSSSIQQEDFQKEINFTQDVVKMFDIGLNRTQIGLISYSNTVVPEFKIGEYDSKSKILNRIRNVEFLSGNTNTGEALSYLQKKGFPKRKSAKPRIAILLTDGQSNDVVRTITEATKVKSQRITIFVIGIGDQVDRKELQAIASKPSETYMFTIGNFDALNSIKEELAIQACQVKAIAPAEEPEAMMNDDEVLYGGGECHPRQPVSLAFSVDTSSIGAENAYYVMALINRLANRLQMNKQKTIISVITSRCSTGSNGNVLVDHAQSPQKIQDGLGSGSIKTYDSLLKDARHRIQQDKTKKMSFIFLSRILTKDEFHKSELESRRAKFKDIEIYVVGVGFRFDESQAVGLTMEKDHYLHTDSYDMLDELESPILYRICKAE